MINKITFLSLCLFLLQSCGNSLFVESQVRKMPRNLLGNEGLTEFLQSNVDIEIVWRQGPLLLEESKLIVILNSENDLDSYKLQSKLWMPSMGHGAYPIKITKIGAGVFELSEIFFTMEGKWDLHLQLFHQDIFLEETKWPIEI